MLATVPLLIRVKYGQIRYATKPASWQMLYIDGLVHDYSIPIANAPFCCSLHIGVRTK